MQPKPVNLGDQYSLGHIKSLGEGIGYLIPVAFAIAGMAVVIYFILGAFKLVFSGGDKTRVQSARDMIVHAIIGFILLFLMFIIFEFITEFFGLHFDIIQWR